MRHICHAPGCTVSIPPRLHMCKRHWYSLPLALRQEVWAHYRQGQEVDKKPSEAYLAAIAKTKAYITKVQNEEDNSRRGLATPGNG